MENDSTPSKRFRILVLGDVMLDRYTYVRAAKQAAEAPITVWDELRDEYRLGGAGNVALNLASIGGEEVEVWLAGIVGMMAAHVDTVCASYRVNTNLCFGGATMVKHRYVEEGTDRFVARFDSFRKFPAVEREFFTTMLRETTWGRRFDAVVVSDYDKGTVTDQAAAVAAGISDGPLVVDTKRIDLRPYRGYDFLKLNLEEYSNQVSMAQGRHYRNVEELFKYVVVTKGRDGAELREHDPMSSGPRYVVHTEKFPTPDVPVRDVTGCGDTFTAALAFMLTKSGDPRKAVRFANLCASQAVQRFGTSVTCAPAGEV